MKKAFIFVFMLFATIMLSALFAIAQNENCAPFVSNIHAGQRPGTKLVDITYDVDDPDGGLPTISVAVSNDGGKTWLIWVLR